MPREVIIINVGGAGVNVGDQVWKQFMAEHSIAADGSVDGDIDDKALTFFEETSTGAYVPRNISVDLETTSIDQLRNESFYHPEFLLSGSEDAGGNFARGHDTVGKEILDQVMDGVRKLVNTCENVQGFMMNRAISGGTGSGLGGLILERLAVDYRKKCKIGCEVFAGARFGINGPCTSYNEMFSLHGMLDHTDLSVMYDNKALFALCKNQLNLPNPKNHDLNTLIAKATSSITAPLRFDDGNSSMSEIQHNLVPFPRLHFMTPGLSPISSTAPSSPLTYRGISDDVLTPQNMLVKYAEFDVVKDMYLGLSLNYRGAISSKESNSVVQWLQKNNKVSFAPLPNAEFKAGFTQAPVAAVEGDIIANASRHVTMLGNNVAINGRFQEIAKTADKMYSQRAYVHNYVEEGMEESEFSAALEDLASLNKDYNDVLSMQADGDDEDDE